MNLTIPVLSRAIKAQKGREAAYHILWFGCFRRTLKSQIDLKNLITDSREYQQEVVELNPSDHWAMTIRAGCSVSVGHAVK